ncbi:MAG: ArsR family transcriptional regulator [Clostridiales bacterium]|jgi:predicted transcriptional regulator|nr:ArsR family transcriptional regulator [Clostridiales bacterium]
MDEIVKAEKALSLSIYDKQSYPQLCAVGKALSAEDRLKILHLLQYGPKNLLEISKTLEMPISSVSKHIGVLTDAGLIFVNYQPSVKGHSKMCNKSLMSLSVRFDDPPVREEKMKEFSVEMPLGQFTECAITAPCGMTGATRELTAFDNPNVFFSPERAEAELLWFETGFISYSFPNHFLAGKTPKEITFSFEVCSEAIYYRNDWPSDITVLINGKETATFTSPGDFGGRRGKYSPKYWNRNSTQFGVLKSFTVNRSGTFEGNACLNRLLTVKDLRLAENSFIQFSIGVKETALHRGGINLFGKKFGNYPQSIVMTVKY